MKHFYKHGTKIRSEFASEASLRKREKNSCSMARAPLEGNRVDYDSITTYPEDFTTLDDITSAAKNQSSQFPECATESQLQMDKNSSDVSGVSTASNDRSSPASVFSPAQLAWLENWMTAKTITTTPETAAPSGSTATTAMASPSPSGKRLIHA